MPGPAVNHETVERRLASADLELSGSEIHGLLCGLLCSGRTDAEELWLEEIIQQEEQGDLLLEECRQTLNRLHDDTQRGIKDPGFGFSLLLPDDEKPIALRAAAVVDWCQGFLYGIGLCGGLKDGAASQQALEALQDIGECTRMDLELLSDGNEEEEEALMQITEFLWVAAMLVRDEIGLGSGVDS